MTLVDRLVKARYSPAVLRASLVSVKGHFPDLRVLIFEGVEDVGVYQEWIRRCRVGRWYRPIPGRGKKQLLELYSQLVSEGSALLEGVAFFVDHDFDGLRGVPCEDGRVFMTDRYAVENYLFDDAVIDEILSDELRCAADPAALAAGLAAFRRIISELLEASIGAHAIYRCAVIGKNRVIKKAEKLNSNLRIRLEGVERVSSWEGSVECVVAPSEECVRESEAFIRAEPNGSRYRGKWVLASVRVWLGMLYEDRRSAHPKIFPQSYKPLGPTPDQISLRSLASRSPLPEGFRMFVQAL